MAKINISFNGTDYPIDESALAAATAVLQSHFSTVMNGTGETITLNGTSYNVDATKLSVAKNDFVSHLGTIAGNGSKVKVNGVEYPVDTAKVSDATAELHAVLGGMISGGGEEEETIAAGLYETGTTNMIMSWDELIENGILKSTGSVDIQQGDKLAGDLVLPKSTTIIGGSAFYGSNITSVEIPASVTTINNSAFMYCYELKSVTFEENSQLTTIEGSAFYNCTALTSITIPASVTNIGQNVFHYCSRLTSITFEGTKAQWNAIKKASNWRGSVAVKHVQCVDGTVRIG